MNRALPPWQVALRLMGRLLRRDWRAGELTVLGLALTIAVASLTSVGFLTDRVGQALVRESHQLLGGDLLLSADHPLPPPLREEARRRGLALVETLSFPSMARNVAAGESGDSTRLQLADIKAVTPGYPLRGNLRIADGAASPPLADRATREIPARGSVWLDERLAAALGAAPGSRVQLGARQFAVAAILTQEPDRGVAMFGFAPRLLMHLDDIPATGLVRPASRVAWRLQLAGDAEAVARYAAWVKNRLGRGERLEDMNNARPEMRAVLDRAQRFLRLAALLAVVLAAIAVGYAADRYLRRHLDGCAVMRCLGASQGQLLTIHAGEFVLFGLFATLAGCLLGYGAQLVLQHLLAGLPIHLLGDLPPPSWRPWAHGLLVGVVLVAGFAVPPLLRLRAVPTLRVLRREWHDAAAPAGRNSAIASHAAGFLALAGLMLWIAGELRLGGIVIAGFAGALGLYALLARLLLTTIGRGGRRLVAGGRLPALRLALAGLHRQPVASMLQVTALGLGLTALLLLGVARDDLLASWQSRLPPDAPNRFVINIQPEQRAALRQFFAAHGLAAPTLEPMIRARLTAINELPIARDRYADERAQHLADREFNLSWKAALPPGNHIVAGRWHGEQRPAGNGPTEFSVEQGLARTLQLKLGDRLSFEVAGQRVDGRIGSLRRLDWDSMRVNFFVIAPPGVLDDFPASDITSFHLPPERAGFIDALVRTFPNLTAIDVAAMVRQLQTTLDQVSRAVEMVFAFALLTGLVVLYAALQASQDQRRLELALLRALGAGNARLRHAMLAEFALLGGLAGLLGGLGATAIAWSLARFVLQLDYLPDASMVLLGLLAGAGGIALAGWLGNAGSLRRPALAGLRGEG